MKGNKKPTLQELLIPMAADRESTNEAMDYAKLISGAEGQIACMVYHNTLIKQLHAAGLLDVRDVEPSIASTSSDPDQVGETKPLLQNVSYSQVHVYSAEIENLAESKMSSKDLSEAIHSHSHDGEASQQASNNLRARIAKVQSDLKEEK